MRLFPDADTAKECIISPLVTQITTVTVLIECKVHVQETRRSIPSSPAAITTNT